MSFNISLELYYNTNLKMIPKDSAAIWPCRYKSLHSCTMEAGVIGLIGDIFGMYWGNIGLMEKKMETTIMGVI